MPTAVYSVTVPLTIQETGGRFRRLVIAVPVGGGGCRQGQRSSQGAGGEVSSGHGASPFVSGRMS